MHLFSKKKIETSKRVCIRLKEAREAAGLTLDEVVEKTKIQKQYLRALEACEFDKLPMSGVYQRHFIKRYLRALGRKPESFLPQFVQEEQPTQTPDCQHPHFFVRARNLHNLPLVVRSACLIALVAILIGYLGLQIKHIVEPPKLVLQSPLDGFITDDIAIMVQGETEKETTISINGKEISNNGTGQFQEQIDLQPGINTLIISAKKKYGKTTTMTRHVILRDVSRFSLKQHTL